MTGLSILFVLFILSWVCIYTVSYGLWTLKKKNRFGALMLFALALIVLGLPLYAAFFRG